VSSYKEGRHATISRHRYDDRYGRQRVNNRLLVRQQSSSMIRPRRGEERRGEGEERRGEERK